MTHQTAQPASVPVYPLYVRPATPVRVRPALVGHVAACAMALALLLAMLGTCLMAETLLSGGVWLARAVTLLVRALALFAWAMRVTGGWKEWLFSGPLEWF
jgi:hypothetical protein